MQANSAIKERGSRWIFVALILILLLAAGLRFYGLREKGLFNYDEAYYLLEAKYVYTGFKAVIQSVRGRGEGKFWNYDYIREHTKGLRPMMAKPGFTALILAASLWTGFRDYTSSLVSAVLGVLTVFMVFKLGGAMFGRGLGLVAAASLASSGYHIFYSRSGLAESASVFFFTTAVYFYYRSLKDIGNKLSWNLIFAGILAGYAYSCNWRFVMIPMLLWFWEAARCQIFKDRSWARMLKRYATISLAMLSIFVIWEIPYHVIKFLGDIYPLKSYWEQLFYDRLVNFSGIFSAEEWYAYLYYIWKFDSPFTFIFLLLSTAIMLLARNRKKKVEILMIFSYVWPILIFFSIYKTFDVRLARSLSLVLPGISIAIAYSIFEVGDYLGRAGNSGESKVCLRIKNEAKVMIACVLIIVMQIGNALDVVGLVSRYRNAAQYVRANGNNVISFINKPIWQFYLGAQERVYSAASLGEIEKLGRDGNVRLMAVDYQVAR